MRFAQASAPMERHLPGHIRPGRVVSLAIAALTIIPLAAGCRVGGAASGHPVQNATITVAAIQGVDNAPLYIAHNNGTFSRAGLDVQIRTFHSVSAELQALSNGKVDIAAGDYVDFFSIVSKTTRPFLSIVADGYHAAPGVMEVLTYPGSGVTTPRSLVHHTVGTPAPQGIPASTSKPYSLETLATDSVLTNAGVDPKQVTWKPMDESKLIGALKSHEVAAILVAEPYIFQAESSLGAVVVLDSCSGATANLPLSGYFATSSFVHNHQAALSEFRSALQHAQEGAVLPGPVRAQLATDPTMNMQSASLVTIGSYPTSLNAASLQRVADLMFNAEMLSHSLSVSGMIAH
ncbi:MAG TPA: ABC transporter substrate-binding protein [Streptosporangiaceae bacterium]|nr:ABC transporter substrate-binding protein [Streptosporangiaceae bacterium]